MELILYQPEIPPNTGNIARLCAVTGVRLHLIEPLGFALEDRYLKRAGLDYWPRVDLAVWPNLRAWHEAATAARGGRPPRCVMTSARGGEAIHRFPFAADDCLVFGPETRGLPEEVLALSPWRTRIPMIAGRGRCLNLATSAGIALYAALARCGLLDGPEWRPSGEATETAPETTMETGA